MTASIRSSNAATSNSYRCAVCLISALLFLLGGCGPARDAAGPAAIFRDLQLGWPPARPAEPIASLTPGGEAWFSGQTYDPAVLADPADPRSLIMLFSGLNYGGTTQQIGRATANVADPTTWRLSNNGNPVIMPGNLGEWDDLGVRVLSVVYASGTLYLYYQGQHSSDYAFQIGLATSTDDGLTWVKNVNNPILTGNGNGRVDGIAVGPAAVVKEGSVWHMWYSYSTGFPPASSCPCDTGYLVGIRYATSSNGSLWRKAGVGDVFSPPRWIEWHQVRRLGLTYVMVYETGDFATDYSIHLATATAADGVFEESSLAPWTKSAIVGRFDRYHVATGAIYFLGGEWYLFYAGASDRDQPFNTNHWSIGVAPFQFPR